MLSIEWYINTRCVTRKKSRRLVVRRPVVQTLRYRLEFFLQIRHAADWYLSYPFFHASVSIGSVQNLLTVFIADPVLTEFVNTLRETSTGWFNSLTPHEMAQLRCLILNYNTTYATFV